jgi:hypothetical protein
VLNWSSDDSPPDQLAQHFVGMLADFGQEMANAGFAPGAR